WRSWDYKEQAAEALQLTAQDLLKQKVIDLIIPEPLGGAHRNPREIYTTVKKILTDEMDKLMKISPDKLVRKRREKFYQMGVWVEEK
ncbi:MAG: acetyl-CoA carboxylase carboxyl transferase subunit alpha, partial [Bacteroidota bacterium]|nr:acetyl-CoA carboxylase carboxyl transferase subunit alpha [Bacteroidota bacterium]